MATIERIETRRYQGINDTGSWEFIITESDGQTIRDLTDYAAWLSVWQAADETTLDVRPAYISDAANGKVRYDFDGDEFSVIGDWAGQVTLQHRGAVSSSSTFFNTISLPVMTITVVSNT